MNETGKTIAKNASFLMISQALTWGLSILLMVFLPRYLGPEGMGQLYLAISLWAIISILVGFGMDIYLTKEIARVPEKANELLGASLILSTILYVVGLAMVVLYLNIVDYAKLTNWVILIHGFSVLFGNFTVAIAAVLTGLEQMKFVAFTNVATRFISTVVVIALLLMDFGVLVIAAVSIGTSLISLIMQLYFLGRLQPLNLSFRRDVARKILIASIPYLLVTAFAALYHNIDAVVISLMVNETTLGWYGVADRLFGTMMFIPVVFITAVFPALSRMNVESTDKLYQLMGRSFDLLLILGVPIGLGLIGISTGMVSILYGADFAPSGSVLAVLGIVLIFTYQDILIGRFLIAVDRQNSWTVVMAVATILTIPLDIILIPWTHSQFGNGAIGGALSYLITESGMMFFGLRYLPSGSLTKANAWVAIRVIMAGLVMLAVVLMLKDTFILFPIIAGAITYVSMILVMRVVSAEDKLLVKSLIGQVRQRILGRRPHPVGVKS